MTSVLNESSLPIGKEQEELVDLWLVHLWMCGGCCQLRPSAEPQATGILLSPSPAKGCVQTQNAGAGFSFADGFISPGWEDVELLTLGCEPLMRGTHQA